MTPVLTTSRSLGIENEYEKNWCKDLPPGRPKPPECLISDSQRLAQLSGGFGGFNRSLELTSLPPDSLANEFISFSVYVSLPFPAVYPLTHPLAPTARNSSTRSCT
jgi:hypothetical protein